MRKIKKSTQPVELREFIRLNPAAKYEQLPGDVKEVMRARLCEDQHYLCVYCMSRIEQTPASRERYGGSLVVPGDSSERSEHLGRLRGSTIEHWIPQTKDPSRVLDWTNLWGVCSGRRVWSEGLHCDAERGDEDLKHLDPSASVSVSSLLEWSIDVVSRQRASVKGLVVRAARGLDEETQQEINAELETLKLNIGWLAENRQRVLQTFRSSAAASLRNRHVTKQWIVEQRRRIITPDEHGRLPEYVGVLLWELERWERKAR